MVVVKWTSAPVATLTRSKTDLLSEELNPTLPFMADDDGRSMDAVVSMEVVDGCCMKLGRPAWAGLVRAAPTMTREGRRCMRGAFAVFCFT
jgi:hypothetical protein